MYLIANGKKLIEMKIMGYEFPDESKLNDPHDLNWLNIAVRVETKHIHYFKQEPIVLTWEIADMITGLEQVLAADTWTYETDFLEPALRMVFYGHDRIVEVDFRHQFCTGDDVWETYRARFSIPKREFGEVVNQLKTEFSKFPKRG